MALREGGTGVRLSSVEDLEFQPDKEKHHAALVAIGSEPRSTLITERLLKCGGLQSAVHALTFEGADDPDIRSHRAWFAERIPKKATSASADDDTKVYDVLNGICSLVDGEDELRLLVDYSSMPRSWYSAVLNWFRSQRRSGRVILDFTYAVGRYGDEWIPKSVKGISAIQGCDGGPTLRDTKIAVFGLGFDRLAAYSVLEQIEPDTVLAYIADPGATDEAPDRARKENREFLDNEVGRIFRLPLDSVETAYRILGETISASQGQASVILVPLGPKPHILASVLAAYRYPGTACLRVVHQRRAPHRVEAMGQVIATRVVFTRD